MTEEKRELTEEELEQVTGGSVNGVMPIIFKRAVIFFQELNGEKKADSIPPAEVR